MATTMHAFPRASVFPFLLSLFLILTACADKPEEAREKLKAKGIPFAQSTFIEQIRKDAKKDIIQLFLTGGMTGISKNKEGVNALMAAAERNNLKVLSLLLDVEESRAEAIKATDKTGASPLLYAANHADEEVVSLLLKQGADPLQADKAGNLPLHKAIERNLPSMVSLLLDASEKQDKQAKETQKSVNRRDGSLEPPLVRAARLESTDIAEELLSAGALPSYGTPNGYTALMAAAEKGNLDMVSLLIGAKSDVNAIESGSQATALTYAIRGGQLPIVEALVEAGADPDHLAKSRHPLQEAIGQKEVNIPIFDYLYSKSKQAKDYGAILLFDAAASGNKQIVASLLQRHINPNTRGQVGETPLSTALSNGHVEVALLLIEHGAKDEIKSKRGPSMMEMAMKSDNIDVLQKLLEYGADVNMKTREGLTLAEVAAGRGLPGNLDLLLSKGAKLDKNKALVEAVMNGNSAIVSVLLRHGADANLRNEDGDTVLWVAAATNQAEAVLGLMNAKANPELTNNKQPGMTPLSIAAYSGNLDAARVLVDHGAKLESKDETGRTPLLYAIIQLKTDVVSYLLAKGASLEAKDKLGRNARKLAESLSPGKAKDEILALITKAETPAGAAPAISTP